MAAARAAADRSGSTTRPAPENAYTSSTVATRNAPSSIASWPKVRVPIGEPGHLSSERLHSAAANELDPLARCGPVEQVLPRSRPELHPARVAPPHMTTQVEPAGRVDNASLAHTGTLLRALPAVSHPPCSRNRRRRQSSPERLAARTARKPSRSDTSPGRMCHPARTCSRPALTAADGPLNPRSTSTRSSSRPLRPLLRGPSDCSSRAGCENSTARRRGRVPRTRLCAPPGANDINHRHSAEQQSGRPLADGTHAGASNPWPGPHRETFTRYSARGKTRKCGYRQTNESTLAEVM